MEMYNIIIADDEKNIREGIVDLIEWEELNCHVSAALRNGEQVLEYLKKSEEQIHIVITDIRMPIMGGMELAGILRETYPDISVIILTAYSDFTYARQAIKYQVADFVVKNEFFVELPKAMARIVKDFETAKYNQEEKNRFPAVKAWKYYRVCACEVKAEESFDFDGYRKNMENLLETSFRGYQTTLVSGEDNLFYFVVGQQEREDDSIRFQRKLEKFISLADSFQNLRLRIGVSCLVEETDQMLKGKKLALRNLSNIYNDENPIRIANTQNLEIKQYWLDDGDIDSYMRNLYIALRSGDPAEKKKLEEFFMEYLQKEERSLEQCKSDTHSIISYLFRKIKITDREEKVFAPEIVLDAVYKTRTKAGLWDVIRDTCMVIQSLFLKNNVSQNELIQNVEKIIHREYGKRLNLKLISQKLFVNSSYLSRIYKKETGLTVTDAINEYRVRKAKEILDTKEYKVYEVGKMVGIEDPAYFTHVFLKYEGQTPTDYMNKR